MIPWDDLVAQADANRPCLGFCNEEGVGPFAGLFCVDEDGHPVERGHLYEDPRTLASRLEAARA